MKKRVLITGAGGVGGVNFSRVIANEYFTVGTDHNSFYHIFPPVDLILKSLPHIHKGFISQLQQWITEFKIDFLHPQPTLEAIVISKAKYDLSAKTYLPRPEIMELGYDKYESALQLDKYGVRIPRIYDLNGSDDLLANLRDASRPYWVRARKGAGGRLSLDCDTPEEVYHWLTLWEKRKALTGGGRMKPVMTPGDWMVQEYIGGQDIAWDALFHDGELLTSFARERLIYPFKNQLASGVGGTPSVSKIIHSPQINKISLAAINALDAEPHGFYCVDLKMDLAPYVTEVNIGKAHTTLALWGYAMQTALELPWYHNMSLLYTRLGLEGWQGETWEPENMPPRFDLYPEGFYLIRQIDCGVWLWKPEGYKKRIL